MDTTRTLSAAWKPLVESGSWVKRRDSLWTCGGGFSHLQIKCQFLTVLVYINEHVWTLKLLVSVGRKW